LGADVKPCTECGAQVCNVCAVIPKRILIRHRSARLIRVLCSTAAFTSPTALTATTGLGPTLIQTRWIQKPASTQSIATGKTSNLATRSSTKTAAKRRRLSYAKPRQSSRNRAGRLRVKAAKGHSPQPLRGKKSAGVADVICGLTSWVSAGCAFHASSLRRPRHTKMFNGRLERMGKWYANSHAACLRND
jgi:hypothetical protein